MSRVKGKKFLFAFTMVCTSEGMAFMIARSKEKAIKKIVKQTKRGRKASKKVGNQTDPDFETEFLCNFTYEKVSDLRKNLENAPCCKLRLKKGRGGLTEGFRSPDAEYLEAKIVRTESEALEEEPSLNAAGYIVPGTTLFRNNNGVIEEIGLQI